MTNILGLKKPKGRREGKKTRKHGRNKVKCAEYRRLRKHEKSHVKRILKHMERYKDNSPMVLEALERYRRA